MHSKILTIIFILLLVDSFGAVCVAWAGGKWYTRHMRIMSRYFPAVKGWTLYYLVLVLFIGYILKYAGVLGL